MDAKLGHHKKHIILGRLFILTLVAALAFPTIVVTSYEAHAQELVSAEHSFYRDVNKDDYFGEAVQFFTLTSMLPSAADGLFRPKQPITRGEFFLWLASFLQLEESSLSDGDAHSSAQALVERGLITGYQDGSLQLDATISRAEVAVILQRVLQLETSAVALANFTDVETDLWYSDAISALANYQLIKGKKQGLFAPHDLMTKAEAITLRYRALYQSRRIEDIQDGQLVINGQAFAYHADLAGLFAEENRSALLQASIGYTMKDGVLKSITNLYINNSTKEELVLNGNGAKIDGDLFVTRSAVSLSNLKVAGGLFVTDKVTNSFSSKALEVEGFTFFMPTASSLITLQVHAVDTSFGTRIISRDVRFASTWEDVVSMTTQSQVQKKLATVKIAANNQTAGEYLKSIGVKRDNSSDFNETDTWNRQDITVILGRLLANESEAEASAKSHTFDDVTDPYYDGFISWANEEGLFQRQSDQRFGYDDSIPKEEFSAVMRKILGQNLDLGGLLNEGQITRAELHNLVSQFAHSILIGTPNNDSDDSAQLEVHLEEGEQQIIVISDTHLSIGEDAQIDSVLLLDVANFTVEGDIERLVVHQDQQTETTLSGTGNIGELEVGTNTSLNIELEGSINKVNGKPYSEPPGTPSTGGSGGGGSGGGGNPNELTLRNIPDQVNDEGEQVNLVLSATRPPKSNPVFQATGLPNGLSMNSVTGTISGILAYDNASATVTSAVYNVTVNVSTAAQSKSQSFKWTIYNVDTTPTLTVLGQAPDPLTGDIHISSKQSDLLDIQLDARDVDGDQVDYVHFEHAHSSDLSGHDYGLPYGLTFDPITQKISGRPLSSIQPGDYYVMNIVVKDNTPHPPGEEYKDVATVLIIWTID